ncbi:MAG: carboxypeptidase regulatory-like domain-containing protein [candidate division Zixibacteria bacterium]|nr:carboxypeptidase regulatory-like domain-containing protein [candidate division Zixibacteria bacterium]
MTQLKNGITNGWDWYPIFGGRQDYMNYFHGSREVTIELSNTKLLNPALLPAHWEYNRVSLFDWLRQANYGIRGIVTDSSTGDPVAATVTVIGRDSASSKVFTDPDIGDYYRMLEPGTYSLQFSAEGYDTLVLTGISVSADSATVANVLLILSDSWICGDIDNNGVLENIIELVYLVDYIFRGGSAPENELAADVNGSGGTANILDLTYMVDYVFRGGPEPSCK